MQRGDHSTDKLASGWCNLCLLDFKRGKQERDRFRNPLETCKICQKKARRQDLQADGDGWSHKRCLLVQKKHDAYVEEDSDSSDY